MLHLAEEPGGFRGVFGASPLALFKLGIPMKVGVGLALVVEHENANDPDVQLSPLIFYGNSQLSAEKHTTPL